MVYIQYIVTLLTIVLIPVMLRIGKKRNIAKLTYAVFAVLILVDIVMFAMLSAPLSTPYLYLAVMTALAMLLVRKK